MYCTDSSDRQVNITIGFWGCGEGWYSKWFEDSKGLVYWGEEVVWTSGLKRNGWVKVKDGNL